MKADIGAGQLSKSAHSGLPMRTIAVPTIIVLVILGTCFLTPLLPSIHSPSGGDVADAMSPLLTPGHYLGTDVDGNDVLARLLFGGQSSLLIALAVNMIGLCVGGSLGALSGYLGGIWDSIIMRILDVLIAFPSLVLIIAVAQALGPSGPHTVVALSVFSVPAFARVARSSTLPLASSDFIFAARLCGSTSMRTLYLHIVPNIFPSLLSFMLLGMGFTILIEGALSFLGLGVRPPAPSWGNMIAQGQQVMATKPSLLLLPSVFLLVTVMTLNWLGDILRQRWCLR